MEYHDIKPSDLLRIVNQSISYNIQSLEVEKFMTITAICINNDGKIFFSGRHEDLIIYREKGTVDIVKTDGICISTFPLGQNDKNLELKLNKGDVLLLYTDGIIEAMDDVNKMFSEKRLISILEKTGNLPTEEILENIIHEVKDYEIHDDVTMIVIKKIH